MDVMGHEGHTPEGWEKVRKWVNTKALPRKRVRGGKSTLKRLKGFHPDLDGRWRPFCGDWKP